MNGQVAHRSQQRADVDPAWQPRIIALVCNWCTYAGADAAGTSRLQYPANVRAVRVPCTGRISPLHIIKAFSDGADAVMVSGCHPGDCHYVQGNLAARRRAALIRSLFDFLGLDERRLHFFWVSASEGLKWSKVVAEVTAAAREVGPLEDWSSPALADSLPTLDVPEPPQSAHQPADEDELARIVDNLRSAANSLLENEQVALTIGYSKGSLPHRMVPCFATTEAEAAELEWNERCFTNLSVYLPNAVRRHGRVGVVLKACDCRTVVDLLQEHQLERENLRLIGVTCHGNWRAGELLNKCHTCDGQVPPLCDVAVSAQGIETRAPVDDAGRPTGDDPRDAHIAFLEQLPAEQRWAYWHDQFSRCLRCYACRAVCPLCYCPTCVANHHQPQWVPTTIDGKGNTAWNAIRALHLAGRCTGCDECTRVCPSGIRLDLINRRLAVEVERRFDYHIGEHAGDDPALTRFRMDDAEEFIK